MANFFTDGTKYCTYETRKKYNDKTIFSPELLWKVLLIYKMQTGSSDFVRNV